MSKELERFIKGENSQAYSLFGSSLVSDGAIFRVYAPRAKQVKVNINNTFYEMEKSDFRGMYEIRVNNVKLFDKYYYQILNANDVLINKDDPFSRLNDENYSLIVDKDEYEFSDENWIKKDKSKILFNGCLLDKKMNIDEQREFIKFLKKYKYTYVILRPYDYKHLFMINQDYINISSLKNFINNLHLSNIGVLFDMDDECFKDYDRSLNDFDGTSLFNKETDKYRDVNSIYFDYSKDHTKSLVKSFINYYLEEFHGDGIYINDSKFNRDLQKEYKDKLFIYKGNENKKGVASSKYLEDIITNYNNGFDHHTFVDFYKNLEDGTYLLYDYDKCEELLKSDIIHQKKILLILLTLTYVSNHPCISTYSLNENFLPALDKLANVYDSSKSLHNSNTMNLLFNGKKHNYFAYQFDYRNEYIILFINFGEEESEDFDLGMPYYGYYKLILDSVNDKLNDELVFTRNKKAQGKNIAIKMPFKGYQALVYKRMRDI